MKSYAKNLNDNESEQLLFDKASQDDEGDPLKK
jgi:hypothetical protein